MALLPAEQMAVALPSETIDLGPDAENRQYQHILAVATSQEHRLIQHAALRKGPGYDMSDPWLVDSSTDSGAKVMLKQLTPGMPCQLVGTGEVVAYLGSGARQGAARVRFANGRIAEHSSKSVMPLPSRPARQGDWAMIVGLHGEQEQFNGRRGFCGLVGQLAGTVRQRGLWVMFEPSDPVAVPDIQLFAEANLVTLPSPPAGASRTPWEARCNAMKHNPTLSLADEGAMDARLALCDEADDDDESDGSVELGSSSCSDEDESITMEVNSLVGLLQNGVMQYGRIEKLQKTHATVKFLEHGDLSQDTKEVVVTALSLTTADRLALNASCSVCSSAEPEDELLMCDGFGETCLNCYHIGCHSPPLDAVPKDAWLCKGCKARETKGNGKVADIASQVSAKAKAKSSSSAKSLVSKPGTTCPAKGITKKTGLKKKA